MGLLPAPLTTALRCPSCAGSGWFERGDERRGAIQCRGCRARFPVVARIPVFLPGNDDEDVVGRALGRYDGALAETRHEPLERAFEVPGAPWIELERFDLPRYEQVAALLPGDGAVLDLGCGYGCGAAPLLRRGRTVVGVDENLFFLLLFRRYTEAHSLPEPALVCHDLERLPYPFRSGVASGAIAISVFNHLAALKPRRFVRGFFAEAARLLEPGGTLVVDMVPNRAHPFPREVNLEEAVAGRRARRIARKALRRLPTAWLPAPVAAPLLWLGYRAYAVAARQRPPGYAAFRKDLGKALPEIGLGALPWRPDGYRKVAGGFRRVEVFDDELLHFGRLVPVGRRSRRVKYFLLRCRR